MAAIDRRLVLALQRRFQRGRQGIGVRRLATGVAHDARQRVQLRAHAGVRHARGEGGDGVGEAIWLEGGSGIQPTGRFSNVTCRRPSPQPLDQTDGRLVKRRARL